MYDSAIKIDPKNVLAYNNKGYFNNYATLTRNFTWTNEKKSRCQRII